MTSDTPRTDALTQYKFLGTMWLVDVEHARTLERELTALRARLEEAAQPDDVFLIGSALDWLENAEHLQDNERCKMIAAILRDLWRRASRVPDCVDTAPTPDSAMGGRDA